MIVTTGKFVPLAKKDYIPAEIHEIELFFCICQPLTTSPDKLLNIDFIPSFSRCHILLLIKLLICYFGCENKYTLSMKRTLFIVIYLNSVRAQANHYY